MHITKLYSIVNFVLCIKNEIGNYQLLSFSYKYCLLINFIQKFFDKNLNWWWLLLKSYISKLSNFVQSNFAINALVSIIQIFFFFFTIFLLANFSKRVIEQNNCFPFSPVWSLVQYLPKCMDIDLSIFLYSLLTKFECKFSILMYTIIKFRVTIFSLILNYYMTNNSWHLFNLQCIQNFKIW